MPPKRSILKEGLPFDYYAPDYKIDIRGQTLDDETKGDVLDVKVTMDKGNLTGFDLTINNWDDRQLDFKYSNTATFDVGNRIHIQMGYAGRPLLSMVHGVITSLTPHFPESGPSTLGVSGQDTLVKLRDRKPGPNDVKRFVKKTDWEIAEIVAARNHLKFKGPQGPIEKRDIITHDIVIQKDQDEAMFLKERAARIDFECYIQIDPDTGEETLFFMKPSDGRDGRSTRVYLFEWGKSLINFNPQLTIAEQVGTVTVRGWDPLSKRPITYTAGERDLPPRSNASGMNGPQVAEERLNRKSDIVVDQPVISAEEAQDLAISLLRERAYAYITGSGQVIGLPDLRPGDNVELCKLGRRFEGVYHVLKVEHTLGSAGYLTKFDVRKLYDGGLE
jgi:Bacteriophage probable baseplate hub protein